MPIGSLIFSAMRSEVQLVSEKTALSVRSARKFKSRPVSSTVSDMIGVWVLSSKSVADLLFMGLFILIGFRPGFRINARYSEIEGIPGGSLSWGLHQRLLGFTKNPRAARKNTKPRSA